MGIGMANACLDGTCVRLDLAIAVCIGLLLFGFLYNAAVSWLEERKHDRGYTAYLVVGGVIVTLLAAIPLIGLGPVLWIYVLFGASGICMIIGSSVRSSKARNADEESARRVAKELLDDKTHNGRLRMAPRNYPSRERE